VSDIHKGHVGDTTENAGSWVKVSWLTDSGEIIKRKYEI
jgi:hypothetical protein